MSSAPASEPVVRAKPASLVFVRLNRSENGQHFIFVLCFVLLAFSGFAVNLPEGFLPHEGHWDETLFHYRSLSHRIAGVLMLVVCIYHCGYLAFTRAGRRWLHDMLPRVSDLTELRDNLAYYLGRRASPPDFGRFNYKHKAEYGALIIGNILMSVSGIILWSESLWSKFVFDIASVVHGMEAVLACLAIMVWHLYEVHLRPSKFPFDSHWTTGVIPLEEAEEEYPRHYREVMADPHLRRVYLRRRVSPPRSQTRSASGERRNP